MEYIASNYIDAKSYIYGMELVGSGSDCCGLYRFYIFHGIYGVMAYSTNTMELQDNRFLWRRRLDTIYKIPDKRVLTTYEHVLH